MRATDEGMKGMLKNSPLARSIDKPSFFYVKDQTEK
jgi:hypothetical protein